jgi:tripartite ATP-independent transporter DctM subunit
VTILAPILLLLVLLGAPLFAVIAAAAFWNFYHADIDLQAFAIEFYGIAEMPILLAIPLFTFAGYLLSESNAPKRLVRLTSALLGWMPAGLAVVSLIACAFFTAFTGASGVTIIALGAILFPAMKQAGYPEKFNLGLVTSAGSLGLLFAPSLPLILYGVVAEVPIESLFLAGLLPGFLMLLILSGYSIWKNRAIRTPLGSFSWSEVRESVRESIWEIPLPIVVLGGIYSGFFAISEVRTQRGQPAQAVIHHPPIDGPGRRYHDDPGGVAGIHQFHDRCRGATAVTGMDIGFCNR